jgi:FtsZ-interacting cell division protein ZipA
MSNGCDKECKCCVEAVCYVESKCATSTSSGSLTFILVVLGVLFLIAIVFIIYCTRKKRQRMGRIVPSTARSNELRVSATNIRASANLLPSAGQRTQENGETMNSDQVVMKRSIMKGIPDSSIPKGEPVYETPAQLYQIQAQEEIVPLSEEMTRKRPKQGTKSPEKEGVTETTELVQAVVVKNKPSYGQRKAVENRPSEEASNDRSVLIEGDSRAELLGVVEDV